MFTLDSHVLAPFCLDVIVDLVALMRGGKKAKKPTSFPKKKTKKSFPKKAESNGIQQANDEDALDGPTEGPE